MSVILTHFAGRAGDHNDRAMRATPLLARELETLLETRAVVIGAAGSPEPARWDTELSEALPNLRRMADHYNLLLARRDRPITVLSRCAVALATLPAIARHRPDAIVVWFDAHADLNTPASSDSGYLGGLALAGPLGLWDSGLGSGLLRENAVLAGTRDLDAAEQRLVDDGHIQLVPVGPDLPKELRRVVAGRPVYVHIDCDVLEPGSVPTDYSVTGGMTLSQLAECARVLAEGEVVGLEVGELEVDETAPNDVGPAGAIITALDPLLRAIRSSH